MNWSMLFVIAAALWISVAVVLLGLAAAAARGDEQLLWLYRDDDR
jgi:hypothetical protein